jgi:conjugal transfer pilus assembly protein TraD
MALNNVGQGLILTGERPSLVKLKSYLEGSVDDLVIKSITTWAESYIENGASRLKQVLVATKNKDQAAIAAIGFYRTVIKPVKANSDLEGLLGMFEHDRTHFGKMIASLLPLLTQLTSGDLGALLSPDPGDQSDRRRITDTANIIKQGQVAYIGLDSLSDSMVGSAVGSILLADLAAVAGDRYNYGVGLKPVNVFVDEAAEAVCDPFIQVLNKGRGALVRATLVTQTLADFEAKLGSPAKARQVLGNVNNVVMLLVRDADTQEYMVKDVAKTSVKYVMRTQGSNTQANPLFFGGNSGERLMEEEADLFPAAMLGEMPTLEMLLKTAGGQLFKGCIPVVV